MFRQEVNKQKQKSQDFQSPSHHHPSNSLLSFMSRTAKAAVRVQTDNTDGRSVQESIISSMSSSNASNGLILSRGKSKSVYQQGITLNVTPTTDTPQDMMDSMNINNQQYAPSKFRLSSNQLLTQQDSNIIEDLCCFKCKNISDEIKECVGCGHLFCRDCINSSDNACSDEECNYSFDNQPDKRNLHWKLRDPSRIIIKKINQLQFKCLNEQLGCDRVLDIKTYANHVDKDCEYIIEKCPNQSKECTSYASSPSKQACLYFGPKKYMHEHLQMCNLKQFTNKDSSKQSSHDEKNLELKRVLTDELNTYMHSSYEESNISEKLYLQHQNSQYVSKIISIGDEVVQSQMDEISDLNKKMLSQSSVIKKLSDQVDMQYEENRKLRDMLEKQTKEADLKISKLQASSTSVMLELQSMKKTYSDKFSELFSIIKELKGESTERSMIKSNSGLTKLSHHSINNSLTNQTFTSQNGSDRSEQNSLQNPNHFFSNQAIGFDSLQPQIRINNTELRNHNPSIEIKNQQTMTPRSGSLFTAKLEEIKTLNGEYSSRHKKYSGGTGQTFFDSPEPQYINQQRTQEPSFNIQSRPQNAIEFNNQQRVQSNQEPTFGGNNNNNNNNNNVTHHSCKNCFTKLLYTKQFLNKCSGCFQNQQGIYICQNCPSRFYCYECCPLYIKKGYCPNNHPLVLKSEAGPSSHGGFVHKCNICSKIFTDNIASKQYTCEKCDFDLCSGCMNMKYINS